MSKKMINIPTSLDELFDDHGAGGYEWQCYMDGIKPEKALVWELREQKKNSGWLL